MRAFEAFYNKIDREFWGMTLKGRADSYYHDIARAKAEADRTSRR